MRKITLICENTVRSAGLIGEHGLAYWIDTGKHRVLFDTGQGFALETNARKLGIDLNSADAIVLSHGHYDHVSGLPAALAAAPAASLWLHPAAISTRFTCPTAKPARRISTDFMERANFGDSRPVHRVTQPTEIVPGLWVTGEIPRTNDYEDTGGPFFLDAEATTPDPILDDMSLYFVGDSSVSVVFGCAHAGAINTLRHIANHTGKLPFGTLVGGLHLLNASEPRIAETVARLREISPRRMGFCHCTGAHAIRRIWNEFPNACFDVHAGLEIPLD